MIAHMQQYGNLGRYPGGYRRIFGRIFQFRIDSFLVQFASSTCNLETRKWKTIAHCWKRKNRSLRLGHCTRCQQVG